MEKIVFSSALKVAMLAGLRMACHYIVVDYAYNAVIASGALCLLDDRVRDRK